MARFGVGVSLFQACFLSWRQRGYSLLSAQKLHDVVGQILTRATSRVLILILASLALTGMMFAKSSSSVALTSSSNPSTYGGSVTFTATVTPSTATGTVTFKDGTATLGTGTLSGGKTTFSTSTLAAGSHSVTAAYGGNTNLNSSTSSALTQTVNKTNTTVTLASSANPSTFGSSVTFTATVSPSAATGTVTFKDVRITMVNAVHTSSIHVAGIQRALGFPIGYVLRFGNGFTIYNTGDTAVTMDMKIVHDLYKPNLVILPIGDFYTMGAEQAAYALNLLQPEFAIGGHWGTWNGMPPGTPEALEKELAQYKIPTHLIKLKPGETLT